MNGPHPSHADILSIYERHGAAWAGLRGTTLGPERGWMERFQRALEPGAAVLDLGCGPGRPIAAWLRAQGHPLCGVDAAEAMLAICRREQPDGEWIRADMRGLDLGRRFGGVLAWDSFFHLAPMDQRAMFAVFARHAAPGAALLFSSGPRAGEAVGALEGEPLYHASLDPDEYRGLLAVHGFGLLDHAAEDASAGGHTAWLARRSRELR